MAKKAKTAWFCNECGAESPKWSGRCPSCGAWNTITEHKVQSSPSRTSINIPGGSSKPLAVNDIDATDLPRIKMPSAELNRVLGGGLVPGSIILIGGEPGIGKSTLVLQNLLAIRKQKILYASGEESPAQIKLRADRIGRGSDNTFILGDTSLERLLEHVDELKPDILIVDSIQTMSSETLDAAPGSVGQVRECATALLKLAKETNIPVILIGHITKEGSLAGPKVLEHIVDAVLLFEGDRQHFYRLLRPIKNRFGSTSELGIYSMGEHGLKEVANPSEMFVANDRDEDLSGIATGISMEGNRPFLIEVQALVSTAAYGTPQRVVTGFDARRLNMLLAVLEKRAGFRLDRKDVFLNIAGGLRVDDPALDLAIVVAVLSSNFDSPISPRWAFAGEVGLAGEIRSAAHIARRINEAARLGSNTIVVPANLPADIVCPNGVKLIPVSTVQMATRAIFTES